MKGRIRLVAGITALVIMGFTSSPIASELRIREYVYESPSAVWREQKEHVICDDCPSLKKRKWSAADFAEKIIKIKTPVKKISGSVVPVKVRLGVPQELKPLILHFEFDSDRIGVTDEKRLFNFSGKLKAITSGPSLVVIEGYTDGVGSQEYNDDLASRRAEAVFDTLQSMGILRNLMKKKSRGKCCYVDSDRESGKNRRVKVIHSKEGRE